MSLGTGRGAVVIEDDDGIRALIRTVLEKSGFDVVSAANGLDGVAAAQVHAPTLVTVDLRMPGIDGYETIRRIRSFSAAIIVVLTALDTDAAHYGSLTAGADLVIRKPFRPRDLRAGVEAQLRQRDSRNA